MAKFTSGPWQTRFLFRMIRRVRESPGDLFFESDPVNDWADAQLMAASPDYHAAAEMILSSPEGSDRRAEGLAMLKAAHDKANRVI